MQSCTVPDSGNLLLKKKIFASHLKGDWQFFSLKGRLTNNLLFRVRMVTVPSQFCCAKAAIENIEGDEYDCVLTLVFELHVIFVCHKIFSLFFVFLTTTKNKGHF